MVDEDLRVKRRQIPPYWWPDAIIVMQLTLAGAIVCMVGYILVGLLGDALKIDQTQRDLLMILFGIILGCFKDVYAYAFGSSAGQKKQGEVITKSLEDKDKIIAGNVAAAATVAAEAAANRSPSTIITTAPTEPSTVATTTTVTTEEAPK